MGVATWCNFLGGWLHRVTGIAKCHMSCRVRMLEFESSPYITPPSRTHWPNCSEIMVLVNQHRSSCWQSELHKCDKVHQGDHNRTVKSVIVHWHHVCSPKSSPHTHSPSSSPVLYTPPPVPIGHSESTEFQVYSNIPSGFLGIPIRPHIMLNS